MVKKNFDKTLPINKKNINRRKNNSACIGNLQQNSAKSAQTGLIAESKLKPLSVLNNSKTG
jgi:hypothetical protein